MQEDRCILFFQFQKAPRDLAGTRQLKERGTKKECSCKEKRFGVFSDGFPVTSKEAVRMTSNTKCLCCQRSNNPSICTIDSPISAVRCKKNSSDVSAESRLGCVYIQIYIYIQRLNGVFLTVAIASRGDRVFETHDGL